MPNIDVLLPPLYGSEKGFAMPIIECTAEELMKALSLLWAFGSVESQEEALERGKELMEDCPLVRELVFSKDRILSDFAKAARPHTETAETLN